MKGCAWKWDFLTHHSQPSTEDLRAIFSSLLCPKTLNTERVESFNARCRAHVTRGAAKPASPSIFVLVNFALEQQEQESSAVRNDSFDDSVMAMMSQEWRTKLELTTYDRSWVRFATSK